MVGVELLAVVAVTAAALAGPAFSARDLVVVIVLAVAGVACGEIAAVGCRRVGAGFAEMPGACSAWTFAGALLLPPVLAAALVVVLGGHLGWRFGSSPARPPHRQVLEVAAVVLACLAAAWALPGSGLDAAAGPFGGGAQLVLLATVAFAVVGAAPSAVVVLLTDPRAGVRDAIGSIDDALFLCAALTLGVLAAAAVLINPWLVLLVLPPLLVLHRTALAHRAAGPVDAATGLPCAPAWQAAAERAAHRSADPRSAVGLVTIELSEWRRVEQVYGRGVLDDVLASIADALRAGCRSRYGDPLGSGSGPALIGVLGRGRFAVFLPVCPSRTWLLATAGLLRDRVACLRIQVPTPDGPLTVSGLDAVVGIASGSGAEAALPELLRAVCTTSDVVGSGARARSRSGIGGRAPLRRPARGSGSVHPDPPPSAPFDADGA